MKKIFLLAIFFSFFAISACSNEDAEQNDLMKAREVAYNSLSEAEKATVITNWKEAEVRIFESGQYLVLFNTTQDALLGPIGVLVNAVTFIVEGMTPRY